MIAAFSHNAYRGWDLEKTGLMWACARMPPRLIAWPAHCRRGRSTEPPRVRTPHARSPRSVGGRPSSRPPPCRLLGIYAEDPNATGPSPMRNVPFPFACTSGASWFGSLQLADTTALAQGQC